MAKITATKFSALTHGIIEHFSLIFVAQLAGAVEYTDCTSTEG